MMRFLKKPTSVLLAALMLAGVFGPFARAAEPEDFPVTDAPLIGNTTDSGKLLSAGGAIIIK